MEKTNYNSDPNVCSPIKTTSELWSCIQNPPLWANKIVEISPRSDFVIKNVREDCHTSVDDTLPKLRLDKTCVPRTLVCHDMKNGYLEDKYINSVNIGNGYSFYRWSQIDIFIYFTHHFITIPPLAWINVAHRNGVKICGTLITEWDIGKNVCSQIFRDIETMKEFATSLVDIAVLFKLDGWLLNIENTLEPIYIKVLMEFVKYLTEQMHSKRKGSVVIWYDSILTDGTLIWQNELNKKNQYFFDCCDGIFLNYTWKEENLINSAKLANHRLLDVYVGVDVFGRNFYGGGKFNTHLAMELIRKHGLSAAIFAPGWTHETINLLPDETLFETFVDRENAFWMSLWPYLYTHPIKFIFTTVFHIGVEKDWFKLHEQDTQLTTCLYPSNNKSEFSLTDICDCLKTEIQDNYVSCLLSSIDNDKLHMHNLFYCDALINNRAIIYSQTKRILNKCGDKLNITLILQDIDTGSIKKVICYCEKKVQTENTISLLEVCPTNDLRIIELVNSTIKSKFDWTLRCYIVDLKNFKLLQIGGVIDRGFSVCLCGLGIICDPMLEVMKLN